MELNTEPLLLGQGAAPLLAAAAGGGGGGGGTDAEGGAVASAAAGAADGERPTVLGLWLQARRNGWQLDQFVQALRRHTRVPMREERLQDRYLAYCEHPFQEGELDGLQDSFARPPDENKVSLLLRLPTEPKEPASPSADIEYAPMEQEMGTAEDKRRRRRRRPFWFLVALLASTTAGGVGVSVFQTDLFPAELPEGMRTLFPVCLLTQFLMAGVLLREKVSAFRRFFLPSSVVGGALACAFLSVLRAVFSARNPAALGTLDALHEAWSRVPSLGLDVVFASLFIGQRVPHVKVMWRLCSLQLAYGQILAWGQYAVGLSIGTLLGGYAMEPKKHLFGVILPIGFEGGHGSASNMKQGFETAGWKEGVEYAQASSTVGLVSGLIIGVGLINWYRRFKVATKPPPIDLMRPTDTGALAVNEEGEYEVTGRDVQDPFAHAREADRLRRANKAYMRRTFIAADGAEEERPSAGVEVVQSTSIDNLAYHLGAVFTAISFGYSAKALLMTFDVAASKPFKTKGIFAAFPTFPLCMLGGIILQVVMQRAGQMHKIDTKTILHFSNMALDFLVLSSIATIRVELVADGIVPFLILMAFGIAWQVVMCLVVAPRFFFDHWFERAIVELGQSTGVTATGLLLLRLTDHTSTNPAVTAFSLKQLLHEPWIGGGVWTTMALPLVHFLGPWPVLGIVLCIMGFWMLLVYFYLWPSQRPSESSTLLDRVMSVNI